MAALQPGPWSGGSHFSQTNAVYYSVRKNYAKFRGKKTYPMLLGHRWWFHNHCEMSALWTTPTTLQQAPRAVYSSWNDDDSSTIK